MDKTLFTFKEYEKLPCEECIAPCCRTLLIPHKTPVSWMDWDFIRYILNFQTVDAIVSKGGDWAILIHQNCIHLDEQTHRCKVHNTNEQPKTCVYYNPYQCYYKINLLSKNSPEMYILDREKFKHWVQHIYFDEKEEIVDAPNFENSIQILKEWEQQQKSHQSTPENTQLTDIVEK